MNAAVYPAERDAMETRNETRRITAETRVAAPLADRPILRRGARSRRNN